MAPPAGSSKHGSHVGSQDSSQLSDDSGLQALVAARKRESKAAKAAHERAKTALARAQQLAAEYEKKVNATLEEYKGKVQRKVKEQEKLEKELIKEMDALRAELKTLFLRNAELLESFVGGAVRESDKMTKELDANTKRLQYFAKEEEKLLNESLEHWWEYSTEGEGEGEQRVE